MKHQKSNSSSNTGTPRKLRYLWQIAAVIFGLALVVGTAIVLWPHNSKNVARFELVANTPMPAMFEDDIVSEFPTGDDGNAIPDVNNRRRIGNAETLIISTDLVSGEYSPAFKANIEPKDLAKDIKITPFIKGEWHMRGPGAIAFTPAQDWPADQKFTIKINKRLFNDDAHVKSSQISFKTAPIAATIDSFAIYPDKKSAKSMIGVAIVSFNYPIDTKNFADKVSLRIDDERLDFSVKFDRFKRTAFIISAPITVIDQTRTLRLKLNRIPALVGDAATTKITADTTIESADNFFKVSNIETTVANNTAGDPEQLILIDMTAAAAPSVKWTDYVAAYLLPATKTSDPDDNTPHKWSIDEINDEVLKKSSKLALVPMDFATPAGVYRYALSYDVSEKDERFIYVTMRAGMDSAAGFKLSRATSKVMRVPYPTRSVEIAGDGALLSLAGDKKLGLVARGGVSTAYVNLYKVKSSEINHLISQTYNVFSDIQFKGWSFDAYDMAVVFRKKIPFSDTSMKRVNYASVDLGDYLNRTRGDNTGIFIIQTGTTQNQADYNDRRLILLTDLGIIRKVNMNQSTTLFVSNLAAGTPAPDIEVSVLGRNGNAIWAGRTDEGGRAEIPQLPRDEYRNEKEPVAIVARRGNDVSFMPYSNAFDRQVEYSKFDVDGVYSSTTTNLNAFLFSDRGIYRPGETATIGGIVKNRKFKSLAGVPVKLEIRNSRGRIALEKTFSLTASAIFDASFEIPADAPLGEYYVNLYSLSSKNKIMDSIGYTTIRVEEFVPDTLKITAEIMGAQSDGWLSPENLSADVTLRNLFGTPATDRVISATAILIPTQFSFPQYAQYTFTPNYISGTDFAANRSMGTLSATIPQTTTDADGRARIDIKFDDAPENGTYEMRLNVTGFESGSGRGVQTGKTIRVSSAKYLVGYRADGNTKYINRGAARTIDLVAIDHTGVPTTAPDLTLQLIKRENLVSLIKDGNGYYKYQTVARDRTIDTQSITIPTNGTKINLDTGRGGTYFLQIVDAGGKTLANIEYFVAEEENATLRTDTDAELQVKLNNTRYAPGDVISVGITAPYAGTGLITIERDRVYAYKWFKTNSTTSVQQITLPNDFEGTGYINVSFVRDINSHDIFTTPYTYAVAPFMADVARRTIDVNIDAPATVHDGKLTVKYETNKSANLMIFAVNSGILQVAKYRIPNPIAHFFKKSALQVDTFQILSLLLPEYKVLSEFAKTGGGDYDGGIMDGTIMTNPFGRRTDAPVAFYSGIINAKANTTGEITFDIPDEFNGELKIFAVAANETALGAADTQTRILSPIVISANAPLFAAPGDTFDVNAVISNLTDDDKPAPFTITANATNDLKITTAPSTEMTIDQNAEKMWTFGAMAGNTLGNSEITLMARTGDISRTRHTTLSVRPTTVFETRIHTGTISKKNTTVKDFSVEMYPEFATRTLYISAGAGALVRPLIAYLDKYEYPCSEQLVSRALPYALMPGDDVVGISRDAANKKITSTINTLKTRQNDDGSFSLWGAGNVNRNNVNDTQSAYVTAYVTQFLTIARENGFTVPDDMLGRGVDFLRTYAGTKIMDDQSAAAHAFAIYVITRNDYVTTGYIDTFREYADKNTKNWKSGIMGAYIAAAYKMLKQDEIAHDLISEYKTSPKDKFEYISEFDNNIANDSIYSYIRNRYFGDVVPALTTTAMNYINRGDYTSYTAANVIMGLSGDVARATNTSVTVRTNGSNIATNITSGGLIATIPAATEKLEIECQDCKDTAPLYYTVIIQGFPTKSHATSDGIEIIREYYNDKNERITSGNIGDTVTVKIFARARGGSETIENVAITDLLPGAFMVDGDAISGQYEFAETREDRILIYTTLTRSGSEFTYSARLATAGTFAAPAAYAASMYNASIRAATTTGKFTVTNATND